MEVQDENKFFRKRLNYQETEVNSCEGRIMHLEDELMKLNEYLYRGGESTQDEESKEIDYPEESEHDSEHDTESCDTEDMDTEQIKAHEDCKCKFSLKAIRQRRYLRQNALSSDDILEAMETHDVPDSSCEECGQYRWECKCTVEVSD